MAMAALLPALLLVAALFLASPANAIRPSRDLLGAQARTVLPGHQLFWAAEEKLVGPADPDSIVHARLHFGPSDPGAVEDFVDGVSDPTDPLYGKFLTVQEFTARWGPSRAYVDDVARWARAEGLLVAYVATNLKYVALEGTVAQFSRALDLTFGVYEVNGTQLRAPQSEPSVPAALDAGHSLHFLGLDQGWVKDAARRRNKRASAAAPAEATRFVPPQTEGADGKSAPAYEITPCVWTDSTNYTYDENLGGCGYTPQQLRDAYGVPFGRHGSGQTVAIVDAYSSPFIQEDLDAWACIMGLPSTNVSLEFPPFAYNASESAPPGFDLTWEGEESLDVEAVHGMAPGAKIVYLGAASDMGADLYSAINYVVERGLASVVSNSWGSPLYGNTGLDADASASAAVLDDIARSAAAVGIGLYFSSGDDGDSSQAFFDLEHFYTVTPQLEAASPYVTAVGGTTLAIGAGGRYVREYGWGELDCEFFGCSFAGGSGGGVAYTYQTPKYQQKNPGVARVLKAAGYEQGRVVPDLAAVGDPSTGFISGVTQPLGAGTVPGNGFNNGSYAFQLEIVGGTSLAVPLVAAMVAIKQEIQGRPFGFINPLIYCKTYMFRDITPAPEFLIATRYYFYSYYAGYDTSLQTAHGYDNVTGLGTPAPQFFWKLPTYHH